jgi:hypothetical protein
MKGLRWGIPFLLVALVASLGPDARAGGDYKIKYLDYDWSLNEQE